jgi:hypothetical protein
MDDRDTEHLDPELDSLLRRNRPTPDAGWVTALEGRLLPERRHRLAPWRLPHVRLGAAVAAGFATLFVALSLAGLGPFGGNAADVRAKEDCRMVRITVVESVPSIRTGSDGKPQVVHRRERVQRYERRCR